MRSRLLPIVCGLLLILAACAGGAATPSPSSVPSVDPATAAPTTAASTGPASPSRAAAIDLTIYGAASLKGALAAAKPVYEAANPGVTLTISTDASSALATQIEQGAPADVFLSADARNPQALVDKGLAAGPPVTFATNELTVIVPADNPAGIKTSADLARPGVRIIAAGDEVPITKYASQLVANLAKEPGYPAGFDAAYHANIVSKEDNVKAVVAKVELGEGDAGIVYVTDAMASKQVATVDVPDAANVIATYDGVTLKASPSLDAATAFLTWFAGPDGQGVLGTFGFLPPS
jgi:molybdate transport system substrate-binding protein